MPSLRSILLGAGLTSLLQTATSTPISRRATEDSCGNTLPVRTTPSLPTVDGATTQLPSTNLTLQYLAIGRGVQNYTCASASAAVVPVALGAVATLYDATSLAFTSEAAVHEIPPTVVYMPLTNGSLVLSTATLDILGKHYFDAAGTPTFDLFTHEKVLHAGKVAAVAAPSDANIGPDGTGAVPWLFLSAKAGYVNVGLTSVYRVVTAGGQPPATCEGVYDGLVSIEYAAEYWFYN